jgi:hypothetical protein
MTATQTTPPPSKTTTSSPFVELRGESGRLYGMLDTRTGVIHVQKGHVQDRIDLSKYAALVEKKG